ncbi:MAG: hypothetical protein ACK4F2_00405 [Novosphingobium meiothermophilum]
MTGAAIQPPLPEGFTDLAGFVDRWALTTTAQRAARRSRSTPEERRAFHDAMASRLDAALDRLDTRPLAGLDTGERNLMNLCLMLAHVALAVETQGDDEARHAPHRDAMVITRSPADL